MIFISYFFNWLQRSRGMSSLLFNRPSLAPLSKVLELFRKLFARNKDNTLIGFFSQ